MNTSIFSSAGLMQEQSSAKVLRNTYLMLGLTMIPTVMGAWLGTSMNWSWMTSHPIMAPLLMLAVMMGFMFGVMAFRNNPLGVLLLLGFTGVAGLMLGPILQQALALRNGSQLVGLAAGGTGFIFLSLATLATVTKKDFSFMGKFLFIGLLLVIVASLANMFFAIPALTLTLSALSVLIFSAYILYDVSRIVLGGETNYVMATLTLYLDLYNLFINLLNLLMMLTGRKD